MKNFELVTQGETSFCITRFRNSNFVTQEFRNLIRFGVYHEVAFPQNLP